MNARRLFAGFVLSILCLAAASPVLGLANRVFVSARSGNNANSCDNVNTPCQTFAGAVTQLNADGEVIVLDSGGYGSVTITKGMTIEAPAGVTAFVHPSSGNAITINAPAATVTLRGLVLNVGPADGIAVTSVGTLNVENCFITAFFLNGIKMVSPGRLNVKGTDITGSGFSGIRISNTAGLVQATVDHCHLDGNGEGYTAGATDPGSSTTTATNTTANHNGANGWDCGEATNGKNVLNVEFCTGSENGGAGILVSTNNDFSAGRYSNCVFTNNAGFGAQHPTTGTLETRGNNTITGNTMGATTGTIPFSPM